MFIGSLTMSEALFCIIDQLDLPSSISNGIYIGISEVNHFGLQCLEGGRWQGISEISQFLLRRSCLLANLIDLVGNFLDQRIICFHGFLQGRCQRVGLLEICEDLFEGGTNTLVILGGLFLEVAFGIFINRNGDDFAECCLWTFQVLGQVIRHPNSQGEYANSREIKLTKIKRLITFDMAWVKRFGNFPFQWNSFFPIRSCKQLGLGDPVVIGSQVAERQTVSRFHFQLLSQGLDNPDLGPLIAQCPDGVFTGPANKTMGIFQSQ